MTTVREAARDRYDELVVDGDVVYYDRDTHAWIQSDTVAEVER